MPEPFVEACCSKSNNVSMEARGTVRLVSIARNFSSACLHLCRYEGHIVTNGIFQNKEVLELYFWYCCKSLYQSSLECVTTTERCFDTIYADHAMRLPIFPTKPP